MAVKDGLTPPSSFPLGRLSATEFLRDYWHKKPVLLRNVWPGIENQLPIDADELAGLASEASADSRLISGSFEKQDWKVRYGPFQSDDYDRLGDKNWTLLVQDVEKHYPPLKSWLRNFSFLPGWRQDDIMISFAANGGSVGPHTDQYDVFLFQASGTRRWQIAEQYNPQLLEHEEVKVLANFSAEQSWELGPGDLLYLPPGVAHFGLAMDNCLTYSIGLRAPSKAEMLADLAEWYSRQENQGGRYADPELELPIDSGELSLDDLARIEQFMNSSIPTTEQATLQDWFGQFITRYRLSGSPAAPEKPVSAADLEQALSNGQTIYRNPWSRFCWQTINSSTYLYATGTSLVCEAQLASMICAAGDELDLDALKLEPNTNKVLLSLLNSGHLILET